MDNLSGGRYQPAPQKPTREPGATPRPASTPAQTPPVTPYHTGVNSGQYAEKQPKKKRIIPYIIAAAILIASIGTALYFLRGNNSGATGIDGGKYQAVFFTNGQVYFGKLHAFNEGYLKMTDIFYLQAQAEEAKTDTKNPQTTTTDQSSNVQLIKLGQEVHGPEDEMIISRDQVLFYENLKADGKVAQTISDYKKK